MVQPVENAACNTINCGKKTCRTWIVHHGNDEECSRGEDRNHRSQRMCYQEQHCGQDRNRPEKRFPPVGHKTERNALAPEVKRCDKDQKTEGKALKDAKQHGAGLAPQYKPQVNRPTCS